MKLGFELNGASVSVDVEPSSSLADVLRERLGARSVHLGCEQGVCGACNVLVEGRVARSCLMVAAQADGCRVMTSEGAPARHPELWELVEAGFVEQGAFQCGFCTSGMVVCLEELLLAGQPVSPERVRERLSGQICRCTGYLPLLAAFETVLARAHLLSDGVAEAGR